MTGTVLYDITRPTTENSAPSAACGGHVVPGEPLHLTHGLVAIANGPDYCLCGHTWPCDRRTD